MKKIGFILSMVLLSGALFAQVPFNDELQKKGYTKTITAGTDLKAKDLYNNAKSWISTMSSEIHITSDEPEANKVRFKGRFLVAYEAPKIGLEHKGYVHYHGTILCKDGKYKYTFTDFKHKMKDGKGGNGGKFESKGPECGTQLVSMKGWNTLRIRAATKMERKMKGMRLMMIPQKANSGPNEDDW